MKLLGCDFDSYFDGVLAQEERFKLIRTRDTGTVTPVALLPSPSVYRNCHLEGERSSLAGSLAVSSSLQVSFRPGLQSSSFNVHIVQPNQYNQNDKHKAERLAVFIANRKTFRSLQRA
jgi:hypothetical protein